MDNLTPPRKRGRPSRTIKDILTHQAMPKPHYSRIAAPQRIVTFGHAPPVGMGARARRRLLGRG